ncbi:MAG: hypothetical protein SF187_19670 [Deltaproteobacteria bacterium]|nr:hypothetical protein [Deltaproteobacteria bacterium]
MTKRRCLCSALCTAVVFVGACDPSSTTTVELATAPALEAPGKALRVRVCAQGDKLALDKTVMVGGDVRFPLTIPLEPAGDDATRRFGVLAELFAASQQRLAWQRINGGYVRGEALNVARTFSSLCNEQVICEATETCADGVCVTAAEAPVESSVLPCDPVTACLAPPCHEPSPYPVGFTWKRAIDWGKGTLAGRTLGNPSKDAAGRPAWTFESVTGNAAAPWYAQQRRLMIWDASFFGNDGSWAVGDDQAPAANITYFDHLAADPVIPVMRWQNPTGLTVNVSIRGRIGLLAQQAGGNSPPADVALVAVRPTAPKFEELLRTTAPFDGANASVNVDLPSVPFGRNDSLLISVRGNANAGWVTAIDDITLTLLSSSRP